MEYQLDRLIKLGLSPRYWLISGSLIYIIFIILVVADESDFSELISAATYFPLLIFASAIAFIIRFTRWRWLMARAGYSLPFFASLLSYLAGFAYTATPGKVGELIRIRYFSMLGVPTECTFGAFIFERSCDLIAVLLLSLFIMSSSGFIYVASVFVFVIVGSIMICALKPNLLIVLQRFFERLRIPLLPRAVVFIYIGINYCRGWLNAIDILIGLATGLAAWTLVGLSFVYLQSHFVSDLPFFDALSIYPLSMLVGAASMIPGGVGSTEAVIVLLLGQYGIAVSMALMIAIIIRISNLWFGILVGFCALGYLEVYWNRIKDSPVSKL